MRGSILGNNVKRVEDPRFITGHGRYLDDMDIEGCLHMALVLSTVPHGRIESIDISQATSTPGVFGVYVADDIENRPTRGYGGVPKEAARPALAQTKVRYVGEVLAAVLADTPVQAVDAAEQVWAEIEPLPAVVGMEEALADGAPPLHEGMDHNITEELHHKAGDDPLAGADQVVKVRFYNQRLASVPLEGSAALAVPDGERVTLYTHAQTAHGHHGGLTRALGLEPGQLRIITPDTGGGFGPKFEVYAGQVIALALARKTGRPIKWIETRTDNMVNMCHGRDQIQIVELAARNDGTLTGLRGDFISNTGAYGTFGARIPYHTLIMAPGPYQIRNVEVRTRSVMTNTTPTHAYRGAGRPEATAMLERAVDIMAAKLNMDPVEIRRRNFIPSHAFPYTTATDLTYDSGDYPAALDRALEMADYQGMREEQNRRQADTSSPQIGIGVASYVEITQLDAEEWSSVELEPDGTFTVKIGTGGTGQGHETVFAQICGQVFSVDIENVKVVWGDTDLIPQGDGTGGSRSLQVGGSAVLGASDGLREQLINAFASQKEASPQDVVIENGKIGIAGVPDSAVSWAELATMVSQPDNNTPPVDLTYEHKFDQGSSYPFGTHISMVEVDPETGNVRILRHIAVDDCGRIFNRVLVDGQVHGGAAQGLGQVLCEWFVYDQQANPLTDNLTTYQIPTADMVPSFEVDHTQTPSPLNPLGAKGIGESGTIGSGAAIHNAVIDALSVFGVEHLDMPTTPGRIWEAIAAARS